MPGREGLGRRGAGADEQGADVVGVADLIAELGEPVADHGRVNRSCRCPSDNPAGSAAITSLPHSASALPRSNWNAGSRHSPPATRRPIKVGGSLVNR